MPTLKEVLEGKKEEPPKPVPSTPRKKIPITKIVDKFDKQEYTDMFTALDHFLRTYNNPKRQDKIKLDGVVDLRNKRIILLKDKLKKILNY